ncbi:MAG: 50S ribosomal protein L23 [Chloroflexaceae bacterium]|nr:50S ribosomal protein L23 [Chloroflexaceae bacterium]
MNHYQVIIRPLITEKNTFLRDYYGQYIFEVDRMATKPQIKAAVEHIFNVTVLHVKTMNIRGKQKRRGREYGYARDWKKAVVTLAEGDKIDLFET